MIEVDRPLVQPAFMFRYSLYCLRRRSIWGQRGVRLEPKYRLPCFGELEGEPRFADLRAAWNTQGLSFNLTVTNRRFPERRGSGRDPRDALHLFISTRDTTGMHRPGQYCHHFALYRCGDDPHDSDPHATWIRIPVATAQPRPVAAEELAIRTESRQDGYWVAGHVPKTVLTGFDPVDHPALGFAYAITDCELGVQSLSKQLGLRIRDDPSLWDVLELVAD